MEGAIGPRGMRAEDFQVIYPMSFKVLLFVTALFALLFAASYFLAVVPQTDADGDLLDCHIRGEENLPSHSTERVFIAFVFFAVGRMLLLIPCVARHIAFMQRYWIHLVWDGLLYIFVISVVLFCYHLVQLRACRAEDPKAYESLQLFAVCSGMLSVVSVVLAHYQRKILEVAAQGSLELPPPLVSQLHRRRGCPELLQKFQTLDFDPSIFGDGDEQRFPSQCSICLNTWEPDDVIKVTPCKHVFHEECLRPWLQTARTCAFCRQDLEALIGLHSAAAPRPPQGASSPATTIGALGGAPGAPAAQSGSPV